MPGGQFGGGGATGRWSRPFRRSSTRSGSYTRGRSFRRPLSRGGNIHLITGANIINNTNEEQPNMYVTPFLSAAYWLDAQLQADESTRWEGELNATLITNAHFRLDAWTTTEVADVMLKLPFVLALAVIGWHDNGFPPGNPAGWTPTTIPNLFLRDWGYQATLTPGVNDLTAYPGDMGPTQKPRVIFRSFHLLDGGDKDYPSQERNVRSNCRLRNILVRKDQMLCFVWGGYNTHLTTAVSVGVRISGTFGYRNLKRG